MIEEKKFYHGKAILPEDNKLKRWVLQQYHDYQLVGHPRITNMVTAVTREFWWPEVWKFVTVYVRGCAVCPSTKASTTWPRLPLLPIMSTEQQNPFRTISVNLITNLPISKGFNSILTIVDQGCSKAAIFLPCQKTIDALGVAMLYAQRVFPFFGIPQWIISYRDPQFMAKFTTECWIWQSVISQYPTLIPKAG
jgi:hypothetical protein